MDTKSQTAAETQRLGFAAQALHYFRRDHQEIPHTPLRGACAWRGTDLASSEEWIVRLSAQEIAELEAARDAVRARGLSMDRMRREDFRLPMLGEAIASWRREVRDGRGFVVVRGLPVARWGDDDAALVYWGMGLHLGRPGEQNPQGDLLGHVIDTGEEATNPSIRRYRTAGDIAYHCDLADAVCLLCLRSAPRGGASRIVSSVSVYNELLARRPDLVDRLFEPFLLDSRDEEKSGRLPYFPIPPCRYANGRLKTFYHSDYFRSVQRHEDVSPFTADERELLDLYEDVARSPELRLDMQLRPGDIQIISNHTILHARTAYEDTAVEAGKRHLLRLWLSFDEVVGM